MNNTLLKPDYLSIERIIIDELSLHPSCKLVDIYKLLFQAFYGPSHAISDIISVSLGISTEYAAMSKQYKPLIQDIGMGNGYCRISLSILDKLNPASLLRYCEQMAELMQQSCITEPATGSMKTLWLNYKKTILDIFPASHEEWLEVCGLAENNTIPSHSIVFKEAYDPHYRVISNNLALKIFKPLS